MSFRLGRGTPEKSKEKKSSGDEMSDAEVSIKSEVEQSTASLAELPPFELSNVRFEKVSESYIKHDKIREETIEDSTPSPVQIADMHDIAKHIENQMRKQNSIKKANSLIQSVEADVHASNEDDPIVQPPVEMTTDKRASVDSIEAEGITINGNLVKEFEESNRLTDENVNKLKTTLELVVVKPEPIYATANNEKNGKQRTELQCPTFEIMPPSRRSSFDPPRSPYLESLRSSCDTNSELMNRNRLDSVGDSFEMIETDRNQSR